MVKKILVFLSVALLSCTAFSACGERPPVTAETYKISVPNSADYTVESDKTSAEEGQEITLTVTLLNNELVLDKVFANDILCEENYDETFSFVMPAEDVTVRVETSQIQEILSSGIVSLDAKTPDYISMSSGADWETGFIANEDIYFNLSSSILGRLSVEVTSTNEAVIPNSAFTVDEGDSYMPTGGSVKIDLTKVQAGTTYVYIHVKSNGVSTVNDTLIKKIQVVEYGSLDELIQPSAWKNSITFDLSKIVGKYDGITVRVYDFDAQYGASDNEAIYTITDEEEYTLEFNYIKNHEYSVKVYYTEIPGDSQSTKYFVLPNVMSGPSTSELGFNELKDGFVTFAFNGGSLKVQVQNKFQ